MSEIDRPCHLPYRSGILMESLMTFQCGYRWEFGVITLPVSCLLARLAPCYLVMLWVLRLPLPVGHFAPLHWLPKLRKDVGMADYEIGTSAFGDTEML